MAHSNLAVAFSATAVLVAVAFCAATYERWWARRRPHDLAWTAAMALFAIGALAYFFGVATGWRPWSFKVFYLAGGVLTVPVLALGTIYLLCPRRLADRVALVVALTSAFACGVVLTAPLKRPLDADHLNAGHEVLGIGSRLLAAIGSGLGATVVIVGALWSAWRLWRGGSPARSVGVDPRRLAAANVAIAVGTLLISVKRPFEVITGSDETGFALALSIGLSVMFAGFLLASVAPTRPSSRPPGGALRPGRAAEEPAGPEVAGPEVADGSGGAELPAHDLARHALR